MIKIILINAVLLISLLKASWNDIDEGLSYQIFNAEQKSFIGDSKIVIVKIDPNFYNINLFSSNHHKHENLTAKEWSEKHNLTVVINAGMFQEDYSSNVGYMKEFDYMNNGYINAYQSVAAFNPKKPNIAPFKIFDIEKVNGVLQKDAIREIINDYNSVLQNLRLIKRPKENRWSQQKKKWSEIALGEDKEGNVLIIFCRSPYSMHDLNEMLINLPINIQCAQHLEGGPESSLYINSGDFELALNGSYESFFIETDNNNTFWDLPNIIGFTKK
tara:strand:- start:468 stop:1286 length:819 start_codon:yes stop_codon:yes gene_type:complete